MTPFWVAAVCHGYFEPFGLIYKQAPGQSVCPVHLSALGSDSRSARWSSIAVSETDPCLRGFGCWTSWSGPTEPSLLYRSAPPAHQTSIRWTALAGRSYYWLCEREKREREGGREKRDSETFGPCRHVMCNWATCGGV